MTSTHAHLPKHNLGAHFLTANTFRRRPYLGDPRCARIFCEELEAARACYGFHVLAFVVMPDHVHLLLWWDVEAHPELTISKVAWAVKGKSARRIVDYLKRVDENDAPPRRVDEGSAPRRRGDEGSAPHRVDEGSALVHPENSALVYPKNDAFAHPKITLRPAHQAENKPHRRNWRYQIWQQGAGYDFNIYTERKLRQKIAYIHANPARAGLVSEPEDYPWSSAAFYRGLPSAHGVTITSFAKVLTG